MKTKHLMLQSFVCALISGALPAAHAESPLNADPAADSFRRMLDHQPTWTTPAVPVRHGADPLRVAISAVLWETQPPSFHLPANHTRLLAQAKTGI